MQLKKFRSRFLVALAASVLFEGGTAITVTTTTTGCAIAGTCLFNSKSYCTANAPCTGHLVDPYTWESSTIGQTWLDFPGERSWHMKLADAVTHELIRGQPSDVTVWISANDHPDEAYQTFSEAGGNLAIRHIACSDPSVNCTFDPDGPSVEVQNDTCAQYFVKVRVTSEPIGVAALSAGGENNTLGVGSGDHICAIVRDHHDVYCWGANDHGQLGNGDTTDRSVPTLIRNDSNSALFTAIDEISVGSWHSCARRQGTLFCWGQRQSGILADGLVGTTAADAKTPTPTISVPDAGAPLAPAHLGSGSDHVCSIDVVGTASCWGADNANQIGHPPDAPTQGDLSAATFYQPFPFFIAPTLTPVTSLPKADDASMVIPNAIAGGLSHTCAIVDGGQVTCWGSNAECERGLNDACSTTPGAPGPVVDETGKPLGHITQITSHGKHTCALDQTGSVFCWGSNDSGQTGDTNVGGTSNHAVKVSINMGMPATTIATGDVTSCAVSQGDVYCWGSNAFGQLGNGTILPSALPIHVQGPNGNGNLTNVTGLAVGHSFVCALKGDSSVWCWGNNDRGQLGDGTNTSHPYPVQVQGLP